MRVVYLEDNVVVQAIIAKEIPENGMGVDDTVSVGMIYDADLNKFFNDSPYPSWVKSAETNTWSGEWIPPTPMPEPDSDGDTTQWRWDEDTTSWVSV